MISTARLQTIVLTSRKAEAREFYGDRLGLRLKGESHGALVYDVGGGNLRVSPVPATEPSHHTAESGSTRTVFPAQGGQQSGDCGQPVMAG